MRRLPLPEAGDRARLEKLKRSKSPAAKAVVPVMPSLEANYAAYVLAMGNPWVIQPDAMCAPQRENLQALYNAPPVALREYLSGLRHGLRGDCPMCGRDNLGDLDHYLPKSIYPEFSFFSKNLVPACSRCNTKRQTSVRGVLAGERALHPYFDAFAERRVMTVQLTPAAAEPRWLAPLLTPVPFQLDDAERRIVQWQIDNVILPSGFQEYTDDVWATLVRDAIRFFNGRSQVHELRLFLDELVQVLEIQGHSRNGWKACVYYGIRNCPGALSFLRDVITGAVVLPTPATAA